MGAGVDCGFDYMNYFTRFSVCNSMNLQNLGNVYLPFHPLQSSHPAPKPDGTLQVSNSAEQVSIREGMSYPW